MNIDIGLDKNIELNLSKEKNLFGKIIGDIVDKTANYAIKMMPVPESIKDVLRDVKEAVKTGDLGNIIKTAVNSSIREGMEFLGFSPEKAQDLNEIKNLMLRGGLRQCLNAGIETAYSSYINGNILGEEVRKFVNSLTSNIESRNFLNLFDEKLSPYISVREDLNNLCEKWYSAYKDMDIDELNNINSDINIKRNQTLLNETQEKDINIINNMTEFVNYKRSKLSDVELNFCNNV